MYQVVCIGSGPSGALAAYYLASKGIKVAIVEKKQFPRIKICGGGLSEKSCKLIGDIIDINNVRGRRIYGSYLSFGKEHLCYRSGNIAGYSVQRNSFDSEILNAAINVGCDIYMPAEVRNIIEEKNKIRVKLNNNDILSCEYVVLAEGITGKLHKQLGYSGICEYTTALQMDIFPNPFPEAFERNTLFDFGYFDRGYGWIFPKDDRISIGSYYYFASKIGRPQICSLQNFARLFNWANNHGSVRAYPLPYRVDYYSYNTNRTVLVGDCAGTVENLYGEGLYYGFLSSKIASEAILRGLNGSSITSYTQALKKKVLPQIFCSRITAKMFYDHQRFGYYKMVRNKLMNMFYGKLIHGVFSQKEIFYYTLFLLPLSFLFPRLPERKPAEVGLANG